MKYDSATNEIIDIIASAQEKEPGEHAYSCGVYLCAKDLEAIDTCVKMVRIWSLMLGATVGLICAAIRIVLTH
jgi:hypothetical protein